MTMMNIGINEQARESIAKGLSRLLADSYALFLLTHNYHWNVTGPMFRSLHNLFEGQYTEMFTAIDDIAERIRALGHFAPGSFAAFEALSSVRQAGPEIPDAKQMIAHLVSGHETVIRTARNVLAIAGEAHDEATVDLLTGRLDSHEKSAWMLRSMIQEAKSHATPVTA